METPYFIKALVLFLIPYSEVEILDIEQITKADR